mmetsp:Transcript_41877/g.76548  ORF Transcript_41877/g.76548 Transcript_41877/m.76548 type:complete len:161 (+) Transcript_41877:20-502(+)
MILKIYVLFCSPFHEAIRSVTQAHPDRVLLVDRSYIQDTQGEKTLDGTTLLHAVTSWTEEEPTTMPRVWPAFVANLPCNFQHCDVNPTNTQCPFSPWRKARIIHVIESLKEGEVAELAPFVGVGKGDLIKLCVKIGIEIMESYFFILYWSYLFFIHMTQP